MISGGVCLFRVAEQASFSWSMWMQDGLGFSNKDVHNVSLDRALHSGGRWVESVASHARDICTRVGQKPKDRHSTDQHADQNLFEHRFLRLEERKKMIWRMGNVAWPHNSMKWIGEVNIRHRWLPDLGEIPRGVKQLTEIGCDFACCMLANFP